MDISPLHDLNLVNNFVPYAQFLIKGLQFRGFDMTNVGGRWIKALRFADDQAMVAKSQKGLHTMIDRLDRTSKECGMKININPVRDILLRLFYFDSSRIFMGPSTVLNSL